MYPWIVSLYSTKKHNTFQKMLNLKLSVYDPVVSAKIVKKNRTGASVKPDFEDSFFEILNSKDLIINYTVNKLNQLLNIVELLC